jgi:putative tryptophan/tyrosine transport system substrate-binding protein
MRRREFITLLGGAAAAWPLAARAQQPDALPHVVLGLRSGDDESARSFRAAFEKLGWTDGRNVRIDVLGITAGSERGAAAEIVRSTPAVVLSVGTPLSSALRLETHTVPIVFVAASDPQASGLVDSMMRPGGNVTGFANYLFSMGGKWLEILKEAAPATRRVLVIMQPGNRGQEGFLRLVQTAGAALGVTPVTAALRDGPEIERAIQAFARENNGSLLVLPGEPGNSYSNLIVDLAARHHLPAMYTYRPATTRGGLMSYDTDANDLRRRAAFYVDRILKGVEPGQLPVQLPTKYDLVVNLKTAKMLGLMIPLPLLAGADEVIE